MNVKILEEINKERDRQDAKWGKDQTHPDVDIEALDGYDACIFAGVVTEESAKRYCELSSAGGVTNWAGILVEEIAESLHAAGQKDLEHTREELIQVAAVAVAWVEDVDRRLLARANSTNGSV